MTMSATNQQNPHTTTKADLDKTRADANLVHLGSQRDAARAAGYLAELYTKTASPSADDVGKGWLKSEVDTKNTKIDGYNRGKKKGEARRVPIPEDDEYTKVIRASFDLDDRKDQPNVSRYRTVLVGLIADNEKRYAQMTHDEFADFIKQKGGFEAFLNAKRGNGEKQHGLEAAIRDYLSKQLAERITKAPSKVVVPFNVPDVDDGTVILVGRRNQGQLDVCAVVPVEGSTQVEMLRPFSHHFAEPPEASALFIDNAMRLADLVKHGMKTDLQAGGTASGDFLEVQQVATLEKGTAGPVMSITVLHSDASVVVRVAAKKRVTLTSPASPLMLTPADQGKLRKRHAPPHVAFCTTVTEARSAQGLCWSVKNMALEAKDATVEANWIDPSGHDHKPLTVRGFDDAISVDMSRSELRQLRGSGVLEHGRTGNDKDPTRVNVEWGGQELAFKLLKSRSPLTLTSPTEKKGARAFELKTVQTAVDKALKAGAKDYKLAIDPVGLMRLSWGDDVATYEVFIPARTPTGGLITHKQEPLV